MKPALGLGLAAALVALALQLAGVLRPVELVATDLLMRVRGPVPVDDRVTPQFLRALLPALETAVFADGLDAAPATQPARS